jgi:hypothetical protein
MMFDYDIDALKSFLRNAIRNNVSPNAWKWLENEALFHQTNGDISRFNIAFVAMPRKTGKAPISISQEDEMQVKKLRRDLYITGWTNDRLCRVWLLMHLDADVKEKYTGVIENLFMNAEMSEQVALYSSLPLLAYPESWKKRCAEGIRSNIGQVLESIICNNPYPAEHLDEAAWNQMVLKAIFTEKPVLKITGLLKRRNQNLADSLSDYAHERWAAHRSVNPLLWICVSPFINESNFPDIQRVFSTKNPLEREAAALACYESEYTPAKQLVEQDQELKSSIEKGEVSWASIEREIEKAHSGTDRQ